MNISDFIERSNPEDQDEALVESSSFEQANKPHNRNTKNTQFIIAIMVLSAAASLGLGVLLGQQGSGGSAGLVVSSIPMSHPSTSLLSASALDASVPGKIPSGGEVVGDSSTHLYYFPWCTQVGKISKADEVWFASDQTASAAGYSAAPGCYGK